MAILQTFARLLIPVGLRRKLRKELLREGSWHGVLDLRDATRDPIEALYIAYNSSPVIYIPLEKCRAFQFVGFDFSSVKHPFVQTLVARQEGHCAEYAGSALQAYHRAFQPPNASVVLGLAPDSGSERLKALTALEAVLPWWPDTGHLKPENRSRAVRATARAEMRAANLPQGIEPSMYWFGPFSERQGEAEVQRLFQVFDKIHEAGFKRNNDADGDIRGAVMLRPDGAFRVLINGGEHRAAVAAALGLKDIPIRLHSGVSRNLISRVDVAHWPQVRSGLFTQSQALEIFDRIFDGRPSCTMAEASPKPTAD